MKALYLAPLALGATLCQAQIVIPYHVTDLGFMGYDTGTGATGINASGQICGWDYSANYGDQAWLYYDGSFHYLGHFSSYGAKAFAVNSSGEVTGLARSGVNEWVAFLYSGGMTSLGTLGGFYSEGFGINDSTQVTGYSYLADNQTVHAFLYSGVMVDLGTLPGGAESQGFAINNSGQVAGYSWVAGDKYHAFLYSNGTMRDLGTLPGTYYSQAYAINSFGQVVGYSGSDAFLYSGGIMRDLGTLPSGDSAEATAINDLGEVVGYSNGGFNGNHAFVYTHGSMYDINSLLDASSMGYTISVATGINKSGSISGNGSTTEQSNHAFLLTPVTLPTSYEVLRGIPILSGIEGLYYDDAWDVVIMAPYAHAFSQINVEVSGVSSTTTPSLFELTFTGHVSMSGVFEQIEFYNFKTNSYEVVYGQTASKGTDTTLQVIPSGTLSRFINPSTNEVRALVTFFPTTGGQMPNWYASLNVVNWVIQ